MFEMSFKLFDKDELIILMVDITSRKNRNLTNFIDEHKPIDVSSYHSSEYFYRIQMKHLNVIDINKLVIEKVFSYSKSGMQINDPFDNIYRIEELNFDFYVSIASRIRTLTGIEIPHIRKMEKKKRVELIRKIMKEISNF